MRNESIWSHAAWRGGGEERGMEPRRATTDLQHVQHLGVVEHDLSLLVVEQVAWRQKQQEQQQQPYGIKTNTKHQTPRSTE